LLARRNLAVELIDRQDRHRCHSAHHQPEYHPDHRDPPDSMFAIIASKDGDFALGDEVLGNSVSLLPIRHGQRPRKLGRYTGNYGQASGSIRLLAQRIKEWIYRRNRPGRNPPEARDLGLLCARRGEPTRGDRCKTKRS
jgi:hypothetical protein